MSGGEPRVGRTPGARVALGFALAALAASWNPFAAPFGLVVGVAAAFLGGRALRRAGAGGRRVPVAALALAVLAVAASLAILVVTAGTVGVELPGEPVVKGRTPAELDRVLSDAGERTRAERERASHELDRLVGGRPDGGPASPTAPEGGRDPAAAGTDGGARR